MPNNQVRKKLPAGKGRRSLARHLRKFDPDHLALPQEEIRRLVVRSTIRYKIEPFVKQMVRVMDNLKAGRIRRVARLTISRRDQSRATLIAAISNAAREGNTMAAHETAFLAALYAYENSLDHLRAFVGYLDDIRRPRSRRKRATAKPR
ncbi:MAG TPA: hypothetical protein VNG71_16520 [Pyrinomonadaceae bacterium]|nr:hypothetical protein [Pyrinomonadaceae bacterium]